MLLDVGLMILNQKRNAELGNELCRYGLADKSPQAGRDWLLSRHDERPRQACTSTLLSSLNR